MRIFLFFIITTVASQFICLPIVSAQSPQPYLVDAGNFDCIPIENFGLRGIRLWEPEEHIKRLLGEPQAVAKSDGEDDGEDDGGYYDITIYHYPDMDVEALRQQVDRIIATSPAVAMSSGIRLGDSKADIQVKFGRTPRSLSPDTDKIHLVTCPQNGKWLQEDYVTLDFDKAGILTGIRYEANRP